MSKQNDDFDEEFADLDDDQPTANAGSSHQNSNSKSDFNFSKAFGPYSSASPGMGPASFGGMPSFSGMDSFGGGMGSFGGMGMGGMGMGGFGGGGFGGGGFGGGGFGRFGSGRMGMGFGGDHDSHTRNGNHFSDDFMGFNQGSDKFKAGKAAEQKPKIEQKKEPQESEEQKLARLTKKLDIPEDQQITIVDWAIRGPAQVIRMILQFILIPYKEKKYTFVTKDSWIKEDKLRLQQKYPAIQLPYIEDGQKIIYGTEAMVIYILHKYQRTELLGTNPSQKVRLATATSIYWQLLQDYYQLCYGEYDEKLNWEKAKQKYVNQKFRVQLFKLVTFLKHVNSQTSVQFCWVDFAIAEIVSIINQMDPRFKDHNNHIQNYVSRVFALPQFIVYKRSNRFHERPYNGLGSIFK